MVVWHLLGLLHQIDQDWCYHTHQQSAHIEKGVQHAIFHSYKQIKWDLVGEGSVLSDSVIYVKYHKQL